jgi:hypothetical protein
VGQVYSDKVYNNGVTMKFPYGLKNLRAELQEASVNVEEIYPILQRPDINYRDIY